MPEHVHLVLSRARRSPALSSVANGFSRCILTYLQFEFLAQDAGNRPFIAWILCDDGHTMLNSSRW